MQRAFLAMVLIVATHNFANAECVGENLGSFTSNFEVVSVSDAFLVCDDQANKDNQVRVKEPGCLVKLKLKKSSKSGKVIPPTSSDGFYHIYEVGEICKAKEKSSIKIKLTDIRSECCRKYGENGMYGYKTCTTQSGIKHISQPPEEYIRCNAREVTWKSEIIK